MSAATIHASAVLRRRAKEEEDHHMANNDGDTYWFAAPRLYDFSEHGHLKLDPSPPSSPSPPPAPEKEPSSPSPVPAQEPCGGSGHLCLLALQGNGVGWGVRKRVHYIGRVPRRSNADDRPADPPAPVAVVQSAAVAAAVVQGDEESSSNVKNNSGAGAAIPEADVREAAVAVAGTEEKKKRRRRKPGRGRGFSLHPKKRVRRAAKAEVLEAAAQTSAPVAVAKEEEGEQQEEEKERKVVAVKTEAKQRRKGRGCRLIKRLEEIQPKGRKTIKPPEEAEEEESSQGDSKVALTTAVKKRSRPEPEAEPEAEESGEDEDERKVVVATKTEKKMTTHGRGRAITHRRKKSRRETAERKTKPAASKPKAEEDMSGGARPSMVDRWTARRYASASASFLAVARTLGASAGKPVRRGELRAEARKHIGDTGLLDHLLKHATGTVLPGSGGERLRRRHNADGAMEYWLEPAELVDLRREAGVADPYWVPPPGWKPGDPVSPDACALAAKKQVEALAAELDGVKRHMEQLMKANQGIVSNEVKSETAKAYISHEPYQEKYECMMKANVNLEKKVLSLEEKYASAARSNGKLEQEVLSLKDKYEAVLEKNTRLESQMAVLSTSFLSLQEHLLLQNDDEQEGLLLLNDNGDQQQQQLLLMGPEQAPPDHLESREADKEESNGGGEATDAAALAAGDGAATSSGGGKRTSRKCSVRICRPQGTFQWPDAQPSSPLTPTAAAMDGGGGLALPPTPPSASSTNAASAKLLLLPAPASLLTPSATGTRDVDLQAAAAVQPDSSHDQQLRQTSSWPCSATAELPELKKTALEATAGGCGSVGTELALATPSH